MIPSVNATKTRKIAEQSCAHIIQTVHGVTAADSLMTQRSVPEHGYAVFQLSITHSIEMIP